MSQVALIVRLGLLVRSAAASLEALRDYLGRWECPGRIGCPGTGMLRSRRNALGRGSQDEGRN